MKTSSSFNALWKNCGCHGNGLACYEELQQCWSAPERAYHNWQHLTECLAELDRAKAQFAQCDLFAVEMALWFHDAIYDSRKSDNEERSAELAVKRLTEGGASEVFVAKVKALIMATKSHKAEVSDPDTALILDIDLSILGKSPERFWQYEKSIRTEYAWVPPEIFREKRAEILQGFLQRERLYLTEHFHYLYEAQARLNLMEALEHLAA